MIMPSSKKTTGNLIWLLLACSAVLIAPKFLFSQTESLTIELQTRKGHNCDEAEFFGGVKTKTGLPNYVRFAHSKYSVSTSQANTLVSTGVLQKPFAVLRIDPCTRSDETIEITGLTLTTQAKSLQQGLQELDFECTNCDLKRTDSGTVVVTVTSADSQLVLKNFDESFFSNTSHSLELYSKLQIAAFFGFALSLGGLVLILTEKSWLAQALIISNAIALISFFILYKKRFSLGFNLPFGDDIFESGVALMHYAKYSRYTDLVLYVVPLLASLVVFCGILWWKRNSKS